MLHPTPEISTSDFKVHFEELGLPFLPVSTGFSYNSKNNTDFLSIQDLRNLIKEHVDANFSPK